MKKILFICLLVYAAYPTMAKGTAKYDRHTAVFGRHTKKLGGEHPDIIRIFLDKEGSYYPDISISDRKLRKYNSSLSEWYSHNPGTFDELCNKYNVHSGSFKNKLVQLNDALAHEKVMEINAKCADKQLVNISIHGYDKKAYGFRIIDRLSSGDNKKLEAALLKDTRKKMLFVEVYWDGSLMSPPVGAIHARGYHLFASRSIENALHVGLNLRKVVSAIHHDYLNIITHSLGARVACELLFNADTTNPTAQKTLPTPQQKHIRLCMIAPAIGSSLFDHYFERGTIRASAATENYSLGVVYNVYDFVLNKSATILFFHIGNNNAASIEPTTLGCDFEQDLCRLSNKIAPEQFQTFDMSRKHYRPQSCHYVNHCYIRNRDPFAGVVAFIRYDK